MRNLRKILSLCLVSLLVLSGCGSVDKENKDLAVGDTYKGETFDVTLNDYYYAKYTVTSDIDLTFDKYLAVDITMKNTSDESATASTLFNFEVKDKKERRHVLIDENDKKFSHDVEPGASWDITLVFPVDTTDEYTLYYSEGLKQSKEDKAFWTFDGRNLATEKVKPTRYHNKIGKDTKEVKVGGQDAK